jgi:hypothetical protein
MKKTKYEKRRIVTVRGIRVREMKKTITEVREKRGGCCFMLYHLS